MNDLNPDQIEKRLTSLEIKASLAEDLVERLNEIVARQQEQIDLLLREIGRLARRSVESAEDPVPRSLRDDIPPHY